MDDSAKRLGAAGDDDALPEDLAAVYRADPQTDAIDVAAGWTSLRPRLTRRLMPQRRRVFFLGLAAGIALAASVVLILRTKSDAPLPLPGGEEVAVLVGATPVTTVATPGAEYLRAVTDLEAALRAGRQRLQPETVAAIERSLAVIDRAIRDAEAALAADPANDYAADWLTTIRRRKLSALRQAVSDVNASS